MSTPATPLQIMARESADMHLSLLKLLEGSVRVGHPRYQLRLIDPDTALRY
jgi:hypothetical protein